MNKVITFIILGMVIFVGFIYLMNEKEELSQVEIFNKGENVKIEVKNISKNNNLSSLEGAKLKTKIKEMYPGDPKKQKIFYHFAKELEKILLTDDFDKINTEELLRAVDCMSLNMLGEDIVVIEALVFDTEIKMNKYIDFNYYQSGKFFEGGIEDVNCNFS